MPSASAFSRDMTTTADAASFRLEELPAVTVPVPSNTKAAWQMAKAASDELGDKIRQGIVITKHGYSMGSIGNLRIREAGHPVPDGDSYSATREALDMVRGLTAEDTVLFLVSGGGSALFESPLIPEGGLEDITRQLLAETGDRLNRLGVALEVEEPAVDLLASQGSSQEYGARPLRRASSALVEDPPADLMLAGQVKKGDTLQVVAEDGRVQVRLV